MLQPSGWGRRNKPATAGMNPSELLQHGKELQRLSRAESTRKSYLHWWRTFAAFAVKVGWAQVETLVPLPVHVNVVVQFVSFLSDDYHASTIGVALAAISAIHSSHGMASPTTSKETLKTVEGVARNGKVSGLTDVVVITPDMIRMFLRLDSVTPESGKRWSDTRLRRAKAATCIGFGAFLRKGEIDGLDVCDVSRQADATTVVVKKAKNDQVGRNRSTLMGAEVGDAQEAEQAVWDWINGAGLQRSAACTKKQFPSEPCFACGPLFPRLAGRDSQATKKRWGQSRVTEELRELLSECIRRTWLPVTFDVKRVSAISLRRGGNSAAVAAGVGNLIRAAQGRWLCTETPDEKYTMLHRTEMVKLATTIYG